MTKALYTAGAHVTGGRIAGHGRSSDGALEVDLRLPQELGGQGGGTNPEELLGAAHAGCFSMALAHGLAEAGHPPTQLNTTAKVSFEKKGDGFAITRIDLITEGKVPGIDDAAFQKFAKGAKENCPGSKALAATPITLDAKLVG